MFCRVISLLPLAFLLGCRNAGSTFSYHGGDGSTLNQAVVIHDLGRESELIRAEQRWIEKRFGIVSIQRRVVVMDPMTGSLFDEVELTAADRTTNTAYFQNPFASLPVQAPVGNK